MSTQPHSDLKSTALTSVSCNAMTFIWCHGSHWLPVFMFMRILA
jgi:hypothetical protein